jgi:hypothetical protein
MASLATDLCSLNFLPGYMDSTAENSIFVTLKANLYRLALFQGRIYQQVISDHHDIVVCAIKKFSIWR